MTVERAQSLRDLCNYVDYQNFLKWLFLIVCFIRPKFFITLFKAFHIRLPLNLSISSPAHFLAKAYDGFSTCKYIHASKPTSRFT